MSWLESVLGVRKPIVGMVHLRPLPGDPYFDDESGVDGVIEGAKADLVALQEGGADAVMFSNEFSLPYLTETEPITAITMANVIGRVHESIRVPFGVNVLWDGTASIDLAMATGAKFVREIFTGVYASDFGLWNTSVGVSARHRRRVAANSVRMLFNIVPEAASYLGSRELADIARSTIFNAHPDALCVSGLTAGVATDTSALETVKSVALRVPVFANTGVTDQNVVEQLRIADGAIVGSYFKRDAVFENPIDVERVKTLMALVRKVRR